MFTKFLSTNQLAGGGLMIMVIGSIGGTLYKIVPILWGIPEKKIYCYDGHPR